MCIRAEATSFETLGNLVHSPAFFLVLVCLFASLKNWCRNVPLATVTWAEDFGHCSQQWSLKVLSGGGSDMWGGNCEGSQGHGKVGGGIGARRLPLSTKQNQSRTTLYCCSLLLLANFLCMSPGGPLGAEPMSGDQETLLLGKYSP